METREVRIPAYFDDENKPTCGGRDGVCLFCFSSNLLNIDVCSYDHNADIANDVPHKGCPVHKWKLVFSARIVGLPESKPRHRDGKNGGKYTPKTKWEDLVSLLTRQARAKAGVVATIDGAVKCDIIALFPRPKKLQAKKYPDGRILAPKVANDLDNIEKLIWDTYNKMKIWSDDRRVCDDHNEKYYCARDEEPGVVITVYEERYK